VDINIVFKDNNNTIPIPAAAITQSNRVYYYKHIVHRVKGGKKNVNNNNNNNNDNNDNIIRVNGMKNVR